MAPMTTTTNLDAVRANPKLFTWGAVEEIIDLGPYTIIRYKDRDGKAMHHIYVEGRDTSLGAHEFEAAAILAFAYAKLGITEGPAMARAACKLLNLR